MVTISTQGPRALAVTKDAAGNERLRKGVEASIRNSLNQPKE